MNDATLCVLFAASSGVIMTFSALAITVPAHATTCFMKTWSRRQEWGFLLVNLALNGAGVACGISAVKFGPQAMATPIGVGSQLLSNMFMQGALGITSYTKEMGVGILVLACSVALLTNVGPGEQPAGVDDAALLTQPLAIGFIIVVMIAMGSCVYTLVKKLTTDNEALVLVYATLGPSCAVLNTANMKALVMAVDFTTGAVKMPYAVVAVQLVFYCVMACLGMGAEAMANSSLEDPGLFVPIGAGVNLVLSCLAGLCIWQDWKRLASPFAYGIIYFLVVLGTYLLSTFDPFNWVKLQQAEIRTDAIKKMTMKGDQIQKAAKRSATMRLSRGSVDYGGPQRQSRFSALLSLDYGNSRRQFAQSVMRWGNLSKEGALIESAVKADLKFGLIEKNDVVDLCWRLMKQKPEIVQSPVMLEWLQQMNFTEEDINGGDCLDTPLDTPPASGLKPKKTVGFA